MIDDRFVPQSLDFDELLEVLGRSEVSNVQVAEPGAFSNVAEES